MNNALDFVNISQKYVIEIYKRKDVPIKINAFFWGLYFVFLRNY